jgi:PAS domain S-box-containing protein
MPKRFLLQTLIEPWQNLSVRRQGFLVVAIPLLCLIGSLGAFSWLGYSIERSQKWVDHTNQILLESNQLLTQLLNAETGVRGYALTASPEFLAPYNLAQSSIASRLNRLEKLVNNDPWQQARLQNITEMMQQRVATLVNIIARIERSDSKLLPKSELNPLMVQGKVEMDRLRAGIAQFEQSEQNLLAMRQQELRFQRNINETLLWAAAILSALASVFTLILFSRLSQNLLQREQGLRQSSSLLEAIISNVVDGVIILNPEAYIETINAAAVSIFGYSLPQVIHQDLSFLLSEMPAPGSHSHRDYWRELLLRYDQPWQATGRQSNGVLFPLEISVSQISLDQRMIVIIRDITERQQAKQKLQARAEELTQLNRTLAMTNTELKARNQELDQFAYVASHDLKAPLRAIASLSEWIEEDLAEQLSEENSHQMLLLRSRVKRMEALINGLLYYGRIGRTQVAPEAVDVGALVEDIIETLAPLPTFTITIAPNMPTFKTRRLALRQVLTNLLDNALVHHSNPNGNIAILVKDQGERYEFTVQDDGNGIEPHYHDKIFTIFQTLQSRDVHESTGMGLAIIKKILDTEGGDICLESQIGKGAAFRFTWPKFAVEYRNANKHTAFERQTKA